MYFNRKIVLDKDHRPVRAWPELNLTLSSKVEGFRLEALQRINPHISSRDILARMPPKVIVENRGETIVRSQMKSNALSMRKRDFRGRNCMLSWTVREGTMEIKEYLDSLLGPELLAKNSTRDMRPLTHDEILHVMLLLGKGRHPERSRHKGTSGAAVGEIGSSKRKHRKRKVDEAFGSEVPAGIDVRRMDGELHDDGYDCDNSTYAENAAEPLHPNDIQDEAAALYAEYLAYGRDPYDFLDCRNHVPTTDQEMHVLAMAIQISIDDYNMLLNADLQIHAAAFHWESYNTQWLALQEALERSWVNRGWDLHTCPALLGYPRWEGSVQDWVYLYAG